MSKVELDTISSGYNLAKINNNFQKIEDELNNKVLYRDSPVGEPNHMDVNLDMNGHSILNASKISTSTLEIGGVPVVPESSVIDPFNGTREALRRSYTEAGYPPVSGSFEVGGTVTTTTQVLLFESDGKGYSWGGALPKTVPAGSTPASTGGVSSGAWTDRSPFLLRTALGANSGATLVKTSTGETVEGRFVRDEKDISNIKIATPPNQRAKSIMLSAPRGGQREAELKATYGYTFIYPQGLAQDPQTGEWFVPYFVAGGPDNNVNWIDVYDSNFVYTGKTFGIRSLFAEGLLIGYVSGQRKVGHSGLSGDNFLRVTNVPATASIVDLQIIAPTLTSTVTCSTSMSSYGGIAAIMSPLGFNAGAVNVNGMVRTFKLDEVLATAAPASGAISTINIPTGIIGGYDNAGQSLVPPNPKVTKPQAFALGADGLAFYSGYDWYASNVTIGNGHNPKISQFSLDGLVKNTNSVRVSDLANAFAAAGIPAPLIEPEGLMYDLNGNLISATVVGFNYVLCAEGVTIPGKTQINVPHTVAGQQGGSMLGAQYLTRGISTADNADLNTADRAADHCIMAGLSMLRFQLVSGFTFTVAGKSFTDGMVIVENMDGNTFFITVKSNTGGTYEFVAGGSTPRTWTMKSQTYYGTAALTNPAPLTSIVQRGINNFAQDKFVVAAANSHFPVIFANVTNGQIGTIGMNATTTSYNTTSDERLKNEHGPMPGAMALVQQMVDGGAVQLAAFKSMPDDVRPMALAQRLYEIYPWAVTPGHGEPGDEDFVPWQVDYSQLVPLLLIAVGSLIKN